MTALELTRARLPLFLKALGEALGDGGSVLSFPPAGRERAATVYVRLKHQDPRRSCHYPPSGGAFYYLTADEKNVIGSAVARAGHVADMEAWFKPSQSGDTELCYRVFVKE